MLKNFSGRYVKLVVVLAIIGFVGSLAYLVIRVKSVKNLTVTRYVLPEKRESRPNTGLPSSSPRGQGTRTVGPKGSQISEADKRPITPDTRSVDVNPDTGDKGGIRENAEVGADTSGVDNSGTTPQISAEELRRRTLETRQEELWKQIQAIGQGGGKIDPEEVSRLLGLQEEMLRIGEELGTNVYDDGGNFQDTLRGFDIMREMGGFMARHRTQDGKFPVSKGPDLADMLEKWKPEAAERMRKVIQNAVENGDEFIQRKHLENVQ